MARQPRIEVPDGLYHVISRGIERREIFRDDIDRERYLAIVAKSVDRFRFQLLAYCLMTNHVHLVVQTGAIPLSRIMRSVNTSYAGYFNTRHRRSGYLFQGRYKAFLVDGERYLLSLVRYVHENPVKAGIAERADGYRWSSHRRYLEKSPSWLSSDAVLERFGRNRSVAIRNFRAFFRSEEDRPYGAAGKYVQAVIGEEAFARTVLESLGNDGPPAVKTMDPVHLIEWIAQREQVGRAELSGKSQRRDLSRVRSLIGYLAPGVGLSFASVARELKRSPSGLWRNVQALTKRAESDERLRRSLGRLQRDVVEFANHA